LLDGGRQLGGVASATVDQLVDGAEQVDALPGRVGDGAPSDQAAALGPAVLVR
jgi:hypothetical protein